MRNYLGLDIGTSGCKAAVFDERGRMVALAHRDYELHFTPDGGAELDSDLVIARCLDAMAEAKAQVGGPVCAMAVSSQGEAFTAVDADGRSLCRAMVSSDVRAADFAREWPKRFGEEQLYQITGHTAHPMFTLFKLLWLRDHRPEVWAGARKFLCFEDLLHLRLGLEPAIGWPLAGRTMLFDVRRHEWSSEILAMVGLTADRLARPLASGSMVGQTQDGMLVVAGGHDQTCGALGAGVTRSGVAMYATGTVDCITPAFASPVFSAELRRLNLCTYDHAAPGLYATVAFSLTGGNILKWFRDEFAPGETYEALLAGMPATPTNLLVLPYWTPSGTPYFDCATPGAIIGLRLSTHRSEILRALLEGVAFEMRLNLEILEEAGCVINELRTIGGGSQSPPWNQLKADLLGRRLTRLDVFEAGCAGAAMLACAADTGRTLASIAAEWVKIRETYQPVPNNRARYDSEFDRYKRLRAAIRTTLAG
jgi:xylulokinase